MAKEKPQTPEADELPPDDAAALDDVLAQAGADEPELKPPSLVAALRARGFELDDDADDDAVLSRIEELEQRHDEYERVSSRARQLEALYQQTQSQLQQQREPQPKPEQPAEKPIAAKPEVPEWDPAWEGYLKVNEHGDIVPKEPWVSADLVAKYHRRKKWEREQLQRVLERPSEFFREAGVLPNTDELRQQLRDELRNELLEELRQQTVQEKTVSALNEYGQRHRAHFYDASGAFTEAGQFMNDVIADLARHLPPERAIKYAEADFAEKFGHAPPWRAAADDEGEPAASPEERRLKLQRKAKTNGRLQRIAQPPVATRRGGHVEIADRPESIRQAGERFYKSMLQVAGEED